MASGLGELFVELGTIGDSKELEKFVAKVKEGVVAIEKQMKLQDEATGKNTKSIKKNESGMMGLINKIGKYKVAIAVAIGFLNKFTNELVRSNQEMLNLVRMSDISLSTFNKWDSVGKMFGVEGLGGEIEGLNQRLFELRLTGQGARGFQLAGINPTGDAEQVMEQIRSRIQGMDNTTATYLLQQMGLSPKMITLLRLGREEFENLWATVKRYQLTEKQRKEIEKMNVQLQIAFIKLRYLKDRAILALMPIWTHFIEAVTRIAEGLFAVGKFISRLVKYIGQLKVGTTELSKVITGVLVPALITLGLIFKPVETIITIILLLIEDVVAYFQGGKSGLGYLLYFIDEIQQKINFETPKWVSDMLALVQNFGNIQGTLETIQNIKDGKQNKVSIPKTMKNVVENPATWLFMPNLMPLGVMSRMATKWIPQINQGAANQEAMTKASVKQPNVWQYQQSADKNQTINIDADIYTNSPINSIMDEVARTQFMYGYGQ